MQAVKISIKCIGDAKLQQANIAWMVEEDLDSMQKFGGIQEIAEALDTDLEKGIPGLEQDLCSQRIANTLSPTQARARNRWQWIFSMLRDRKGDESEKGSVALDNVSPIDTGEAVSFLFFYFSPVECGSIVVDSESLVNLFELISHLLDLNYTLTLSINGRELVKYSCKTPLE